MIRVGVSAVVVVALVDVGTNFVARADVDTDIVARVDVGTDIVVSC